MIKRILKKFKKTPMGKLIHSEFWRKKSKKNIKKYSDYEFICKTYKSVLGRDVDLKNPKRFMDKLQWLKLFWRDDFATVCSDKFAVREHLEEKGYGYLLNELIAVYDNIDDFDPKDLPSQFVLKGAHGSGWNLIVKDKAKINWFIWKKIMRSWLKQNLYYYGREWNYEKQKPRIIIEKYLEDDSGELRDYKIFCFNGEPQFIEIDENRFTNHKRKYCDCSGKVLNMYDSHGHNDLSQVKPLEITSIHEEMFKIARDLSKDFPQVRVDLYECNGKIYFGELTFFDGSGFYKFEPDEWDEYWGERLILPKPNHNLDLYNKLHND